MSRETKIGLVTAAGFLTLVGSVLTYKLMSGDAFPAGPDQLAQAPAQPAEAGKDPKPDANDDTAPAKGQERQQAKANEPPPTEPPPTEPPPTRPVATKQSEPPSEPPPTERPAEDVTQGTKDQKTGETDQVAMQTRPMPPGPPSTPPSREPPPTEPPATEPPSTEPPPTGSPAPPNRPQSSQPLIPSGPPQDRPAASDETEKTTSSGQVDKPVTRRPPASTEPASSPSGESSRPAPPNVPSIPKESDQPPAAPPTTTKPRPRLDVPMDEPPPPVRIEQPVKDVPPPPPSTTYDKTFTPPKLGRPVPDGNSGGMPARTTETGGTPVAMRSQPGQERTEPRPTARGRDGVPVVFKNQGNASVDSFDVEVYQVKAGDTYTSISRFRYRSDRYANALARFNKDRDARLENLQNGATIYLPPVAYLERKYHPLIPGLEESKETPAASGPAGKAPVAPAGARSGTTSGGAAQADWKPARPRPQ